MTTDEQLIARIQASMRAEVAGTHPPVDLLDRIKGHHAAVRWSRYGHRPQFGFAMAALASIAAVAIAGLAIVFVGRDRPQLVPSATIPAGTPSAARALVARVAVLRRAQMRSDHLPGSVILHLRLPARGRIIGRLTRLALTFDAGTGPRDTARIYVIVYAVPSNHLLPGLPRVPTFDAFGLVGVNATGTGALLDRTLVPPDVSVGTGGSGPNVVGSPEDVMRFSSVIAGLVPDGVARVVWDFSATAARIPNGRTIAIHPLVRHNIAIARALPHKHYLIRATWYAKGGKALATFRAPRSP
jgi:hypothetical protein